MFNTFFRFILSITSLAPAIVAVSLVILISHKNTLLGFVFLIIAIAFCCICYRQIKLAENKGRSKDTLLIKEFFRRDQGTTTFLFISVLPFLKSSDSLFNNSILVILYVLFIVFVSIVDVGAYNFNPVIRMMGYRFYEIKDSENIRHLLILKRNL